MDNNFQTSFIPKKPLVGTQVVQAHTHVSVFSLLGVVIFVLSIGAAVGVVAWVKILENQKVNNQETLAQTREAFDPALIEELQHVNKRIDTAKELMNSHIAVSNFFEIIEGMTLKSVRFQSFTYNFTPEGIKVQMEGQAESFSSIALQSDVFGRNKSITNPIISNMTLDEDGRVLFDFEGEIPTTALLYKSLIAPRSATTTEAVMIPDTSSTTDSVLEGSNPIQ